MTSVDSRPFARRTRSPAAPVRVRLVALAVGTAAAVLAQVFAPHHHPPDPAGFAGDEPLLSDVEAAVDPGAVQGMTVARFPIDDPDAVERVSGGTADGDTPVDEDTPFETGSVQKVFTAMVLADMVESGDTALDRTLEGVFPHADFADPEVASATLADLASHHSGLPTIPPGQLIGQRLVPTLSLTDQYGQSPDPVAALATTPAGTKGEYEYSNLGYSVLGEALAAESGTDFPDLLQERLLNRLGMDDTTVHDGAVPEGAAVPNAEPGAPVQNWRNTAYAAAGVGTWSTTADLARFLTAVTDGTAPGTSALETVHTDVLPQGDPAELDEEQVFDQALGWLKSDPDGTGTVTEHSGGTFGSQAMVAFDDSQAVAVMANTMSTNAPETAHELLGDDPEQAPPLLGEPVQMFTLVSTLLMVVVPPVLLLSLVLRRRTLITQRRLDRLRVVSLGLGALAWLTAGQRLGSWTDLPMVVWALAAGLVAAGITVGVWHVRGAPTEAGRWRWLHVGVFVLSVVFSLTLGGLALWGLVAPHV